jgi:chromosome segregation ATPase
MVSDKKIKTAAKSEEIENKAGGEEVHLPDTVQTLSRMIKDLEKQLSKMLDVNEALEEDLERERARSARAERDRNEYEKRLLSIEQDAAGNEDLRTEINHLGHERSRLAASIEELGRQLSEGEQENRKLEKLSERLQAERDDVIEELHSVEAQFDHAMEMITDLKARVTALAEERDALVSRSKVAETQLRLTEEQRDSLRAEVDESKKALDEIRRSVADACVMSQRFYYQQEEIK